MTLQNILQNTWGSSGEFSQDHIISNGKMTGTDL